jgi:hypothetical protein
MSPVNVIRRLQTARTMRQRRSINPHPNYIEAGVTWLAFTLPAPSRAAWCDAVAALGAALGSA